MARPIAATPACKPGKHSMKLREIQELARARGIKHGELGVTEIIREIQRREGSFPCFATAAEGECNQTACCWRADCFTEAKARRATR